MSTGLDVLTKAVVAQQPAIVSIREGGVTHQVHIRFGQETREDDADAIWAQFISGDPKLLPQLAQARATVEVAFNTESATVFFDSEVLRNRRQWFTRSLLLKRPEQLSIVERRKGNRELIPQDVEVHGRITPARQTDGTACDIAARVWDVSPTGAAFLCRADQPMPKMEVGEPLAIILSLNGQEHRMNACHRYTQRLSSSTVKLGVQFNGDEAADPQTMACYQQLLEEMQSLNIRRSFRHTLRKRFHFQTT